MIKRYCIIICLLTIFSPYAQEDVNLSNGSLFEGEPYIIVNPEDPNHLVVAWLGFVTVSEKIKIKVRASFDGGQSWSTITTLDHVQPGYTSADPSIAFHPNGDVIVAYIDWTGDDGDPLSGGIQISKSIDGGINFNAPLEVLNLNVMPAQLIIDRPWMVIDRSNTSTAGNIYITSMNARDAEPEYHPFISISTDDGASFTLAEIDGDNWLSGDIVTSPMPTPAVHTNGVLVTVYPSVVFSQSLMPQYILASSSDGGLTFNYDTVFASSETATNNDPLPKKGYLLREDPSNTNHLAFFFLSNIQEDLDIYFTETFDAGENWTVSTRINDDPVANDRLQDLVWADFDNQGDLVVTWRDRRNAPDSGYETASEIWAAFRPNSETSFEPNFQITDETIEYNGILASAGNDFMSVQLVDQVIHTTWGDTRTGTLNIWYQRSDTEGNILSVTNLATTVSSIVISPNPALNKVSLSTGIWVSINIYTIDGKLLKTFFNKNHNLSEINISELVKGTYIFEIKTLESTLTQKLIKK